MQECTRPYANDCGAKHLQELYLYLGIIWREGHDPNCATFEPVFRTVHDDQKRPFESD